MAIKTHRALSAALAGMAFAASAPFAYAAPQADADTSVTKPHVVALAQPRAGERQATSTAPLTMLVEDSAGNAVRLTHVPGTGWKYDRASRADSPLRAAAFQTMPSAAADANADASLTVFIDGPSGFTYVWNRDGGWKFIGKLVDDTL